MWMRRADLGSLSLLYIKRADLPDDDTHSQELEEAGEEDGEEDKQLDPDLVLAEHERSRRRGVATHLQNNGR